MSTAFSSLNLTISQFYLNVFTEFADFSEKILVITVKGLEPATYYVRDQDATTLPAWHRQHRGSIHRVQFIIQEFIRFPEFAEFSEFLFHLGKTPLAMCEKVFCTDLELHEDPMLIYIDEA